jgi:hypothetical protein
MRAELSVTNESEQSLELLPTSDTPLLADIPRLESLSGSAVFLPPDVPGISAFGLADGRMTGCWRFVNDDGKRISRSIIETTPSPRRLAAGETKSVAHDVYYGEPSGECFPASVYETAVPMTVTSGGTEFTLGYRLSVDGDGASIETVATTATEQQ